MRSFLSLAVLDCLACKGPLVQPLWFFWQDFEHFIISFTLSTVYEANTTASSKCSQTCALGLQVRVCLANFTWWCNLCHPLQGSFWPSYFKLLVRCDFHTFTVSPFSFFFNSDNDIILSNNFLILSNFLLSHVLPIIIKNSPWICKIIQIILRMGYGVDRGCCWIFILQITAEWNWTCIPCWGILFYEKEHAKQFYN